MKIIKTELDTDKNEINSYLFKWIKRDEHGRIICEVEYDESGEPVCTKNYSYHQGDVVLRYEEYDSEQVLLESHHYLFNEFGHNTRIIHEFQGGQKLIKDYVLTDLGLAEKAEIRNESDEIIGYEVYKFNAFGQVVEEIELDASMNKISWFEKTYRATGQLETEKHFLDDGLKSVETFFYENDLLQKKELVNVREKMSLVDVYAYDTNGNMISNKAYQNDVLVFESVCMYDESGNLKSEEYFELDYWENRIMRHERLEYRH